MKGYRGNKAEGAPKTIALCIGAQKAGTTWLSRNMRYHPEIYIPPWKEVHFLVRIAQAQGYLQRWKSDTPRDRRWRTNILRASRKILKLKKVGIT